MIKKFLAFISNKTKQDTKPITEVGFSLPACDEQVIDIKVDWKDGDEKIFAELLYALNSGILLEHILSFIKDSFNKKNRAQSYLNMVTHLNKLFEDERQILNQLQASVQDAPNGQDSPLVSPYDVFGGQNKNALTDEGQNEEI